MRQFPHTKRNHRSGNWVYFRRYPLAAQGVVGRTFFERSLKTSDHSGVAERWGLAHHEFEDIVRHALSSVASLQQTPSHDHVNGLHYFVKTEFARWDRNVSITQAPLDVQLTSVRRSIKEWGTRQKYVRAQRIVRDPTYCSDDLAFKIECQEIGACSEQKNWLVHSPKLYDLARHILKDAGLSVPPLHGTMYVIERMVEQEFREVLEAEGRWRSDDFADMPLQAPDIAANAQLAPNGEDYISFAELVDRYIVVTRKPKKTASKLKLVQRYIENITENNVKIDKITKIALLRLQSDALKMPARLNSLERCLSFGEIIEISSQSERVRTKLSPQAIRSWFNLLGGCFNWAVRADFLSANPTQGIKPLVRKAEEGSRKSFSLEDIDVIFDPVFYTFEKTSARFWLPLLALFTGARLNEVGQLLVEDIRLEPVPCIAISDAANQYGIKKSLKNLSSRRIVPVHQTLIRIGFLNFAKSRAGPHLFDDLPHGGAYEPTKSFSQWFGRYLRSRQISDPQKVFHSFRHTFKDECRKARIEEEVHDALTGHSAPSSRIGRSYGSGVPIQVLHDAIDRVHPRTLLNWSRSGNH